MSEQDKQCRDLNRYEICPVCGWRCVEKHFYERWKDEDKYNAICDNCGMCVPYEQWLNRKPTQPKLVLALPDFETRRIVQLHDQVSEFERIVTCAIEPPQAQLTYETIFDVAHQTGLLEEVTPFSGIIKKIVTDEDLYQFAKAIAARCGDAQTREKAEMFDWLVLEAFYQQENGCGWLQVNVPVDYIQDDCDCSPKQFFDATKSAMQKEKP